MKPELILIAKSSEARLFLRSSDQEPLVPLAELTHSGSRQKISQLVDDRAGHGSSDRRPGGVSFAGRIDPKRKQHLQFADELCERIDAELAAGHCDRVAVFASCPFIGELKSRLSASARKALHAAVDADLTALPLEELERRVAEELRLH
jgi:protein required for attachment to host cells